MYKHHSPHRTNPPNNEDPRAPQRRLLKHMAMRREAGHQLKMAAGSNSLAGIQVGVEAKGLSGLQGK
jgi:hypothetical protein